MTSFGACATNIRAHLRRHAPDRHRHLRRACVVFANAGLFAFGFQSALFWPSLARKRYEMPVYSIARAKDNFSRLVDEAVAGEEVAITRHGKVVAYVRPAAERSIRQPSHVLVAEIMARARKRPRLEEPAVDIIRRIRDDYP
jgi:prevent-host-death family protein